jgi:hypothetical protein
VQNLLYVVAEARNCADFKLFDLKSAGPFETEVATGIEGLVSKKYQIQKIQNFV